MNLLVRVINFFFVGQYYADMKFLYKKIPKLRNEDFDRIPHVKNSFYTVAFVLLFPFIGFIGFPASFIFPKSMSTPVIFVSTVVMAILFEFVFKPYYLNNKLYQSALEEYERLSENQRRKRRLIQSVVFPFHIFGSMALCIALGIFIKRYF